MEKEFIPYEQALELKELEFNEPCFGCYAENKELIIRVGDYRSFSNKKPEDIIERIFYNNIIKDFNSYVNDTASAPLYQQAFRWFRDKYNLVHTVYSNASGYIWELHYNQERGGTHICDSGESGDCEMSGMFITYEKAELECLKKLIEIVNG